LDPENKGDPIWQSRKDIMQEVTSFHERFLEYVGEERVKDHGSEKEFEFENQVYETLEELASIYSDTAEKVGKKRGAKGKTLVGDIIIKIEESYLRHSPKIVIEAKKRRRIAIDGFLRELDNAIENRVADWAIGVVETKSSLRKDIGCFRYF